MTTTLLWCHHRCPCGLVVLAMAIVVSHSLCFAVLHASEYQTNKKNFTREIFPRSRNFHFLKNSFYELTQFFYRIVVVGRVLWIVWKSCQMRMKTQQILREKKRIVFFCNCNCKLCILSTYYAYITE